MWAGNLSKGQIPEGQALVRDAFQECQELVEQLQQVRLGERTPSRDKEHNRPYDSLHVASRVCLSLLLQASESAVSSKSGVSNVASAPSAQVSGSSAERMNAHAANAVSSVTAAVQAVLSELKREEAGGSVTEAGVLGYQQHLRVIEGHKHDGVWCGNLAQGKVPEGQAALNELFEEASALASKLAAGAK